MKNQNVLDDLRRKTKPERVKAIMQNAVFIFSEEFISFLEGLMEFAKTISDDPGYFERIYVGEDSDFLNLMKIEMEEQAKLVEEVLTSIQEFENQHHAQVLISSRNEKLFHTSASKPIEEILPCGKCDELIKSHGLCNGCLSGRFPDKVSERLQTNDKVVENNMISNKEILSTKHFKP